MAGAGPDRAAARPLPWAGLTALAALALYLPASLAYVLWRHVDHNEHMYAAAAIVRGEFALYRDFCWIQAPYWIDLQSLAFRLVGGEHLLLTGRLLNWFVGCAGLVVFHGLARRLAGPWPSLGLTALLALSRHFLMPLAEASNYTLSFAACMGSLWCFLRALESRRFAWGFATGLLLAVAAGTKLYYLATWPVFVLVALVHPRESSSGERVRRLLFPGAVGLATGLAPFAGDVLRAPESAWFGNLGYHLLNQFAFGPDGIPFTDTVRRIAWMAGMPETAALLLFLLAAFGVGLACLGVAHFRRADASLLAGLTLLALAAVVSPRPVYIQYFLFPLPLALLVAGGLLRRLEGRPRLLVLGLGGFALSVALVLTGPPLLKGLARFGGDAPTTAARQEAIASELRGLVGEREGAVATFSPLHPLEAGLPIERELVTGPFVYRIAHLLEPEERRRHHVVSPQELPDLLAARPPAAVLVGEEGALDEALTAFAEAAGYSRHPLTDGRLVVYLRPGRP